MKKSPLSIFEKERNDIEHNFDINSRTVWSLMSIRSWINEKNTLFFKKYNLSSQQYHVLRILKKFKKTPLTPATIHKKMTSKMCNTTRLIDKLEIKQLIHRNTSIYNHRNTEISITDKGMELLDFLDTKVHHYSKTLIKNITVKEAIVLDKLLNKIQGTN